MGPSSLYYSLVLMVAAVTGDTTGPIDLDTFVVPAPQALQERDPSADINKLLRAELSILEAIEELEMNASRRSSELDTLRTQEHLLEEDLGDMAHRFDVLTRQLDETRALIKRRLRALIQLKRTENYQVLFASDTYATYLRRMRGLTDLLETDQKRIHGYQQQLKTWAKAAKDLDRRRTNLKRTREKVANLLKELDWDREEKRMLLKAIRERGAFQSKVNQELESLNETLYKKVKDLRDENRLRMSFDKRKGKHIWPIWKSTVIGDYGIRTNAKFKTRTVHRGLDIIREGWRRSDPVNVKTIYWGYVAYAGWLRGLGKSVIIDHTRGYMTLYSHLDTISVEVGKSVKTGQKLGTMGDTGSLRGPHLYFELRIDGKAVNPRPWLN